MLDKGNCCAFNQLYICAHIFKEPTLTKDTKDTKTIVILIKINVAAVAAYAERDGIYY